MTDKEAYELLLISVKQKARLGEDTLAEAYTIAAVALETKLTQPAEPTEAKPFRTGDRYICSACRHGIVGHIISGRSMLYDYCAYCGAKVEKR